MTATYDSIATTTLGSAATNITFNSIPATYTDLVVTFVGTGSATGNEILTVRFNGDTGTNYSATILSGYDPGAGPISNRETNQTRGWFGNYWVGASTTSPMFFRMNVFSYAGSTNKTVLSETSNDKNGSGEVNRSVGLWRSTSAINSITLICAGTASFGAGSTATLYGIKSEQTMPTTYQLIASNTLGSSAASVTFSSIPNTYTDLVLKWSARTDASGSQYDSIYLKFNGNSANYSRVTLRGNGAAAASQIASNQTEANILISASAPTGTANTFSNVELYIPNYAGSTNKPFSSFSAQENNTTTAFIFANANLWSNTSAITSIALTPEIGPNFVSGSSFFLYGIKKSQEITMEKVIVDCSTGEQTVVPLTAEEIAELEAAAAQAEQDRLAAEAEAQAKAAAKAAAEAKLAALGLTAEEIAALTK